MKKEAGATTLDARRIAEARLRKEESRQFLNQPTFLQAGLWYFSKYANVRAQSFHQIYFAADLLKDLGNTYYKQQNIDQAIEAYQEALSVFRFVKPSKEALKKEELTDADLEYVQYAGTNEKENFLLTHIQHVLYLNLSIGYIRTKQFQNAISSCTFDLELDESSVKSLYRRALARYSMQNKQRYDQDIKLAIADLKRALDIDPLDEDIKELLCQIQENNNFLAKPLEKSVPIIPAPLIVEPKKEEEISKKATLQPGNSSSQQIEISDKATEGSQSSKEQKHLENSNEKSDSQQATQKPKLSDFADYKEYMMHTNPQYAEYYKRQQQFAEKHKQNSSSRQSMDVSFESTKTGRSIDFKNKKQQFKLSEEEECDSDEGSVNSKIVTKSKILPKNSSDKKENVQSEKYFNQNQRQSKLQEENSSQSNPSQQQYLEEQTQNQKSRQQQQPLQQQQQQLPQANSSSMKYRQYFQPSLSGMTEDPISKIEPLSKKKEKKKNSEQARQLREIEEEKERQRIHAEEVERQKRRLIELQEQRAREEKQRQEMLEVERARAALRMKVPETKANLKKGIKKNNRTTLADQKQSAQQQHQQMLSRQQQQLEEQQKHVSDSNKHSTEESQDDEKIVKGSKNEDKMTKNLKQQQEYIQSFSNNQNHNNNIAKKPPPKGKQVFEEDDLLDTKAQERLKLLKRNINSKNGQGEFSDDNEETNGYVNRDQFADLPPYIPPNPAVSSGQLDLCEGSSILKQREADKIFQHSYKSDYQDYLDQKHILDSDVEIPEIPGLIPPSYKSYAQKRRETLLNENTQQTKKQLGKYQKILLWSAIIIFIIALWWASGDDSDVTAGTAGNPNASLDAPHEFQHDEGLDEFDLLLED